MKIDFEKMGGLVPAIIQDATTKNVLMLGFMNEEAYKKTIETKKVTFYSRTRKCLWTKGETSGNFLNLVSIANDCDNDTLLIKVNPVGPVCHKGTDTCWGENNNANPLLFLTSLKTL
jgi:phosphoribosyl-ATP pyrophosphohydrolase/phosphoribosyl-AMP cyclohydrolase